MAYLGNFTLSFKNEHILQENEVRCLVNESDFNLTYNPTIVTGSYTNGAVKDFAASSDFHPYATQIGLYNDNNELLAVAKFGKPIMMSPDTDMTFVVKYDV
jgi:phosphomannomutase